MNETKQVQSNRVKAIQAELGLSTEQMANHLGYNVGYYRQKLNGIRHYTLHDIQVIQALSGRSFDYIMGNDITTSR